MANKILNIPMDDQSSLVVDQNRIKFAMMANLLLLAIGWILDSWIPIFASSLCQLIGATKFNIAPYTAIYKYILVPINLVKPNIIVDDPLPHRFASLIGGLLILFGATFLFIGIPIIGWLFVLMVFTLQSLNLWVNFCMMYAMYYLLNRLGVKGFTHAPIKK